jgi:hypothetical protein
LATAVIAADEYFRVELATPGPVLRVVRTPLPLVGAEAADRAHRQLVERLERLSKRAWPLLVDLRDAPPRNDPEFEAIVERYRRAIFEGFTRSAVLVRTAAGVMQLTRHLRQDRIAAPVFDDEDAALGYLTSPASGRLPPSDAG